jgi:hypothetical protein
MTHWTDHHPSYPAQDVRQGRIVLNTRLRKIVFFGGLAGLVVLSLLLSWSAVY